MAVHIEIFDTTLRDGEQSPGASMDEREKVQMAQQLDRLGVDIIEAGFPIASSQEFEAVRKVGQAVERARVAALARALTKDIERAASACREYQPVVRPLGTSFEALLELTRSVRLE